MNPLMPAFPRTGPSCDSPGMNVRTWLAGQALAGCVALADDDLTLADRAADCVAYADALIAALSVEGPLIRPTVSESALREHILEDVARAAYALQEGRQHQAMAILQAILVASRVAERTEDSSVQTRTQEQIDRLWEAD